MESTERVQQEVHQLHRTHSAKHSRWRGEWGFSVCIVNDVQRNQYSGQETDPNHTADDDSVDRHSARYQILFNILHTSPQQFIKSEEEILSVSSSPYNLSAHRPVPQAKTQAHKIRDVTSNFHKTTHQNTAEEICADTHILRDNKYIPNLALANLHPTQSRNIMAIRKSGWQFIEEKYRSTIISMTETSGRPINS